MKSIPIYYNLKKQPLHKTKAIFLNNKLLLLKFLILTILRILMKYLLTKTCDLKIRVYNKIKTLQKIQWVILLGIMSLIVIMMKLKQWKKELLKYYLLIQSLNRIVRKKEKSQKIKRNLKNLKSLNLKNLKTKRRSLSQRIKKRKRIYKIRVFISF